MLLKIIVGMRLLEKFKVGRITLEVSAPVPEKFLNLLWNKGRYIAGILSVTK